MLKLLSKIFRTPQVILMLAVPLLLGSGDSTSENRLEDVRTKLKQIIDNINLPTHYDDIRTTGELKDDGSDKPLIEGTGDPPPISRMLESLLPKLEANRSARLVEPRNEDDPAAIDDSDPIIVEIFSSTEKSSERISPPHLRWLTDVVYEFNQSSKKIEDRQIIVKLWRIPSGLAYQYIASGKYRPQAFTPSNRLWGKMLSARGIELDIINKGLASNLAGIAIKKDIWDEKIGTINEVDDLVDFVLTSELDVGSVDPHQSSTGLNFLISSLMSLSKYNTDDIFIEDNLEKLKNFEKQSDLRKTTIESVAAQNKAIANNDIFFIEYQSYLKSLGNVGDYVFVPFGFPHDNPLYVINGNVTPEQLEALRLFSDFASEPENQNKAVKAGFGARPSMHTIDPTLDLADMPNGKDILDAQRGWKRVIDNGLPAAAVFLFDVSPSVRGDRLREAKKALENALDFISPKHAIGLVAFSDEIRVLLPVKPFDFEPYGQRDRFIEAVSPNTNYLTPNGDTAFYDGVAVALDLLAEAKADRPNLLLKLFIFSDGETRNVNENETLAGELEEILEDLSVSRHIITDSGSENLRLFQTLKGEESIIILHDDDDDISYSIAKLFEESLCCSP